MKFRWIPAVVLVSILLGVMIGVRINDISGLTPQTEKQEEVNKNETVKSQEPSKVESAEVFLQKSEPELQERHTESGILSKMGRNIDKGVSSNFSSLISRII